MRYLQIDPLVEKEWLEDILKIHETIFGNSSNLLQKMETKPGLVIHVAIENTKVVGYKMGYELDGDKFYSWLGGVHDDYRNQGIASLLMDKQHQYLKGKGYKKVQTKTKNKWRNMLILNIKNGFDIIGTYTDEYGEPKIILEKKLV